MHPSIISTRDIQRNYKEIFEQVKQTKKPVVVMNQKEPQVAIVSLDDLDELQKLRRKNSARALLELAAEVHVLLKDEKLPTDLSTRHDYYLWEEEADTP
jgi:prevent-host-death family protein